MRGCCNEGAPFGKRNRVFLIPNFLLIGIWFAVFIDCMIVGAREAYWLACGMMVPPLLAVLLNKCTRKPVRLLRRAAVILAAALHAYVIGMIAFILIFAGTHTATGSESSFLFLLGSDLKNDRPGDLYVSRIDTARHCLENDPELTLVACGGLSGTNSLTEARAAQIELTSNGIAPERIICEDGSTRTLDNFNYAAELLEDSGEWNRHQPTAVITNRFHFYRTSRLARSVGYDTVRLIPADCELTIELPWILREVLTVTKFWICGPN